MEMKKSSLIALIIFTVLIFGIMQNVSAQKVTAKLGGSRMVLRLDPNEEIKKSIVVINDNPFAVRIEAGVAGELADGIKLEQENFSLSAGEEKRFYFTVKAPNEIGMTETSIHVRFIPNDGSPVGLSATVIVIVSEAGSARNSDDENDSEPSFSFNPTGYAVSEAGSEKDISLPFILLMSTAVLLLIFVSVILYSIRLGKKKRLGRATS